MSTEPNSNAAGPRWIGLFNDRIIPLPRPAVPVALMRILAGVPSDHVIIRDHQSPEDDVLDDRSEVDLRQGNVFRTGICTQKSDGSSKKSPAKKALTVDDRFELILVDELPCTAVLSLFGLDPSTVIRRDFESADDPVISPESTVRFADGPAFLTDCECPKHIDVAVATTAGFFPAEETERLPSSQPVKVQLGKAVNALGIADVAGWIARVDGREIDVEKSYAANGLKCKVVVDYGRREGGGGS